MTFVNPLLSNEKNMHAGRLRDRVTIQNYTFARLPSGQKEEIWKDEKTVWAEVKGIAGREFLTSGAEKAEAQIRVWMRINHHLSSSSRIRCDTGIYKGEILDVVAPPVPDIINDRIEILCKVGVRS